MVMYSKIVWEVFCTKDTIVLDNIYSWRWDFRVNHSPYSITIVDETICLEGLQGFIANQD